jgi:hypothetical protein
MGNGKRQGRAKATRIQLARLAVPLVALASAPGCFSCFGGGTWIATRRGRKALRDVQVGDAVLSFDVERGRVCEREVVRLFRHAPQSVGRLSVQSGEGPARITPNHPVFIERTGEFWRADSLDEERLGEATARGALFWTGDRLERRVFAPFRMGDSGEPEEVFNLQIAETETYFADGLLVHNKSVDGPGADGLGAGGHASSAGGSGGLGTGGLIVMPGSGGEPAGTAGLGGYGGTIGGQGGLGGHGGAD